MKFTDYVPSLPDFKNIEEKEKYIESRESEFEKSIMGNYTDFQTGLPKDGFDPNKDLIDVLSYSEIDEFDKKVYLRNYGHAKWVINRMVFESRLKTDNFSGNVLNFGCGYGESTFLLAKNSGNLVSVDTDKKKIDIVKKINIFPKGKVLCIDGLGFMEKHEKKFDLIFAFYIGDFNAPIDFLKNFHDATSVAIKKNGQIVITSDLLTMDKVHDIFLNSGIFEEVRHATNQIKHSCFARIYSKKYI